jgi:cation:H+ antiporter
MTDGGLLFGLLLAYTVFLVVQSRRETQPPPAPKPGRRRSPGARRLGQPSCRCRWR